MKTEVDGYDLHMLSLNLECEKGRNANLNRHIAVLFGHGMHEDWTGRFELAAELFKTEFPDWSRECLSNSCQGVYWYITSDDGDHYSSVAETDALALCAAMVKAKRREDDA